MNILKISQIVIGCALFFLFKASYCFAGYEELVRGSLVGDGYIFKSSNNSVSLFFKKDSLSKSFDVNVNKIFFKEIGLDYPANSSSSKRVSQIFQFDLVGKNIYNKSSLISIEVCLASSSKVVDGKVLFFDRTKNRWLDMPNFTNNNNCFLTASNLSFLELAVFENNNFLKEGFASWYSHNKGLFAASPDFPMGSKVRVYNKVNNKYVDVVINDYGPDRKVHPDRVIDLEKTAFSKIASVSEGIVEAKVEPLFICHDSKNKCNNVKSDYRDGDDQGNINLSSKSFVLVKLKNGKVLINKNKSDVLPIASLTKIVAMKTFLDFGNKNDYNKKVVYKKNDLDSVKKYCPGCSISKINIRDGEKVKIKDLVFSSLIGSANNTVKTLVRVSGLSLTSFVDKMNINARKWGAKNTIFTEPTGLSYKNMSSASDYAIIMKEVLKDKMMLAAGSVGVYNFKGSEGVYSIKNTNKLLLEDGSLDIAFSKTGYLKEAGYCLVMSFNYNKEEFVLVGLGADTREASLKDAVNAISYARSASN